ncbi:TPA: hypothetical protein I3831_003279, partial [Enterobacter cloacae]|nr:hypothetical protein [Enterobacter cloacae]
FHVLANTKPIIAANAITTFAKALIESDNLSVLTKQSTKMTPKKNDKIDKKPSLTNLIITLAVVLNFIVATIISIVLRRLPASFKGFQEISHQKQKKAPIGA